jgi:hypothetical protein
MPIEGQVAGSFNPNVVNQIASWLNRAQTALKDPPHAAKQETPEDLQSLPSNEIMNQMQEVERLILEGPLIQDKSAGLPHIVGQADQPVTPGSLETAHADKRLRTDGAEDAEALVGFIRSVRASAEATEDS